MWHKYTLLDYIYLYNSPSRFPPAMQAALMKPLFSRSWMKEITCIKSPLDKIKQCCDVRMWINTVARRFCDVTIRNCNLTVTVPAESSQLAWGRYTICMDTRGLLTLQQWNGNLTNESSCIIKHDTRLRKAGSSFDYPLMSSPTSAQAYINNNRIVIPIIDFVRLLCK